MKVRLIIIGLFLTGIVIVFYVIPYCLTTWALSYRDLEMVFVVSDAKTGGPISNASINMITEDKENGLGQQSIKLVTDNHGRVSFVHENNSCEDVIRPFRETVTLIDLTWASIDVSAKGYNPVKQMWLATANYENKGYFAKGCMQRVQVNVLLHKQADN
jgi:hypothetical protein